MTTAFLHISEGYGVTSGPGPDRWYSRVSRCFCTNILFPLATEPWSLVTATFVWTDFPGEELVKRLSLEVQHVNRATPPVASVMWGNGNLKLPYFTPLACKIGKLKDKTSKFRKPNPIQNTRLKIHA